MQFILVEAKKQRAFREKWVGYMIAGILLLVSLYQSEVNTPDPTLRWYLVQQDIYSYGATLTALLIVLGLPRLICYEKERSTDSLVCTSSRGRFLTWKAKGLFSIFYCGIVVSLIGVSSLLLHCGAFAFEGAHDPVVSCVYFSDEALPPMSNIAYCALQYVFLFLGSLYFAGFVLIVAAITKRTVATIIIGGAATFLCMIYEYAGSMLQGIADPIFGFVFHFGFGGYLFQQSYSWSWPADGAGNWADVWKAVVYVITAIAVEFAGLWLLWRRKDKA